MLSRISAAAAIALAGLTARAQEPLYLRPEAFRPAPGQALRVHLESPGKPVDWDPDAVSWLFVRGEGTQENLDAPPPAPAGADARLGVVALPGIPAGEGIVGVDLRPVVAEVDAAALRAFVAARCQRDLPASVKGRVRLMRVQSCKAVLRTGPDGAGGAASMTKTGQAAEILPRLNPTRAMVGSDIAVKLSVAGRDPEDFRVLATCVSTGKVQEFRTGKGATGHFTITDTGMWRVEFHLLEPAPPGEDGWVLTSGTLTFEAPQNGGAR